MRKAKQQVFTSSFVHVASNTFCVCKTEHLCLITSIQMHREACWRPRVCSLLSGRRCASSPQQALTTGSHKVEPGKLCETHLNGNISLFFRNVLVSTLGVGMTVMNHLLMKNLRVFSEKVALSYLTAWREESLF